MSKVMEIKHTDGETSFGVELETEHLKITVIDNYDTHNNPTYIQEEWLECKDDPADDGHLGCVLTLWSKVLSAKDCADCLPSLRGSIPVPKHQIDNAIALLQEMKRRLNRK